LPLIVGVVRAADRPIRDARVFISRAPVAVPDVAQLTDAGGRFALSVPVNGTYEISCRADVYPPRTKSVTVDRERVEVELVLP